MGPVLVLLDYLVKLVIWASRAIFQTGCNLPVRMTLFFKTDQKPSGSHLCHVSLRWPDCFDEALVL